MGLDQYAHVRFPKKGYTDPITFVVWRKHNRLHGWMENLYRERGGDDVFNTETELPLSIEDIDDLERDIVQGDLPQTSGFFFGSDSYEHYANPEYGDKRIDEEFIGKARNCIAHGGEVTYTSWW